MSGPVTAPASAWNDKLALLLESTGDGIFGIEDRKSVV